MCSGFMLAPYTICVTGGDRWSGGAPLDGLLQQSHRARLVCRGAADRNPDRIFANDRTGDPSAEVRCNESLGSNVGHLLEPFRERGPLVILRRHDGDDDVAV